MIRYYRIRSEMFDGDMGEVYIYWSENGWHRSPAHAIQYAYKDQARAQRRDAIDDDTGKLVDQHFWETSRIVGVVRK